MRGKYGTLGALGRPAVIRAHLAATLSPDELLRLAQCTLRTPCPPLKEGEALSLLRLFWDSSLVRDALHWTTWRDLIRDKLSRGWTNAQVGFIADVANRLIDVRAQIVDNLLEADVNAPVLHVNVFKRLVGSQPQWVAERLLNHQSPTKALAAGGVAEGVVELVPLTTSEIRHALIEWLKPCRGSAPRNVWSAQIILAADSVPTHQQIFDELMAANEPQIVIDSAVDAWIFQIPERALADDRPIESAASGQRCKNSRVPGPSRRAIGVRDEEAQLWVAEEVLHGSSPRVAGTAIKTIADSAEMNTNSIAGQICRWLTTLIEPAY